MSVEDFAAPESRLPNYRASAEDNAFLTLLSAAIRSDRTSSLDAAEIDRCFAATSFPKACVRIVLVLYAPGCKRILVSRPGTESAAAFLALLHHGRRRELAEMAFRIQMDFICEPPLPVDYYSVGMDHIGERHFEVGVDGLLFKGADGKQNFFLPGDAYVRSIMGMKQLREYLNSAHGEPYVRQSEFRRLRSESYISGQWGWLQLYRGHPLVGQISKTKIEHAVALAIGHIQHTQTEEGKFLYYYDAALDSRRDHEHPGRDPDKNPFYNILRHGGGGLTCIYYEKAYRRSDTLDNIRLAIEYLIKQTRYQDYDGREGGYIYHEKKSKLGGSGIALYLVAEYQLLTGDMRYRDWSDKLAWHLLHQITSTGEFIYYNIYLDRLIGEDENHKYFSFYYPGEAVCALAKYLHVLPAAERAPYFERLHHALEFLIVVRPGIRAEHYTEVPSDSWLMMGIMELWDFPEMRRATYSDFVFSDATKMIDHMYKVTDAPYPDYAGAFYYQYGDYPYADGARCEGLLGAFELAVKMGDKGRIASLWPALKLAAWALMHLVNTEDSIYSARNPDLSLGGIRFKYTRQWFRIDTIQHVSCFFAKLLPHWDRQEAESGG